MTKVEPRLLLKDFLVLSMEWVKDGRDEVCYSTIDLYPRIAIFSHITEVITHYLCDISLFIYKQGNFVGCTHTSLQS